uniref:Uncharacterized protein n=1 Tax=Rhizophora mucronata TaxID=61149 RepID=A0A2P2NMR9_RHIMU
MEIPCYSRKKIQAVTCSKLAAKKVRHWLIFSTV